MGSFWSPVPVNTIHMGSVSTFPVVRRSSHMDEKPGSNTRVVLDGTSRTEDTGGLDTSLRVRSKGSVVSCRVVVSVIGSGKTISIVVSLERNLIRVLKFTEFNVIGIYVTYPGEPLFVTF